MSILVKNLQDITDTWCGQTIEANGTYEIITVIEQDTWAHNSKVITDIANENLGVSHDGGDNWHGVVEAIECIRNEHSEFTKDTDGKVLTRAESRPLACTTVFTTRGDDVGSSPEIGGGPRLEWDASESEGWIESASGNDVPEGFKRKTITIQFLDSIWIKDGTIYYMDAKKNSYVDMKVICPHGGYYMYLGGLYLNTTGDDLVVDHYITEMPIQGNVPMGDELNTETCSQELPNYLKYEFSVVVPTSDTTSYGYGMFEIYRTRTVII